MCLHPCKTLGLLLLHSPALVTHIRLVTDSYEHRDIWTTPTNGKKKSSRRTRETNHQIGMAYKLLRCALQVSHVAEYLIATS